MRQIFTKIRQGVQQGERGARNPLSREEIERQAAAELAAATGLGAMDPSPPPPDSEEAQPLRP